MKSASAMFSRTLSLLLGSGLTLTDSLELTANNMKNIWYKEAIMRIRAQVSEGWTLNAAIKETKLFPPMVYNLTGIGEEMLFRGTIQRIFSEGKVNTHIAVWCSAFIFSALHFQLFGFIPRMLLGAFFGYLYVWSGSLWLPILAHALNNSLSTLTYYDAAIDTLPWIGNHPTPALAIVSAIATALMVTLYIMCIVRKRVRD